MELKIGIDKSAYIASPSPGIRDTRLPIVFYGTSITQGGCASRAGMSHTSILSRWLDRQVINLGFSGAGKMEPAMAELIQELDAALFVLECLPNMTNEMVRERLEPFVVRLKESHPDTPLLLVENLLLSSDSEQNKELQKIYARLKQQGFNKLYYLDSAPQLEGRENGTVDSVHPTDLGFYRMAEAYYLLLQDILE